MRPNLKDPAINCVDACLRGDNQVRSRTQVPALQTSGPSLQPQCNVCSHRVQGQQDLGGGSEKCVHFRNLEKQNVFELKVMHLVPRALFGGFLSLG